MTSRTVLVPLLLAALSVGCATTQERLRLETRLVDGGLRVALIHQETGRAHSDTGQIRVFTGYLCTSPDSVFYDTAPFELLVDGHPRSPNTCESEDRKPVIRTLRPGERHEVSLGMNQEEDQGPHRVTVRYRPSLNREGCWQGSITSPALVWPSALSLLVRTAENDAGAVEVEVEHRNVGSTWMTVFTGDACTTPIFDSFLVDGRVSPAIDVVACPGKYPEMKTLQPGASITTRTKLRLPRGSHTIQAIYQALRSKDFTLVIHGVSTNIGFGHLSWQGTVRSAPVTIDVR